MIKHLEDSQQIYPIMKKHSEHTHSYILTNTKTTVFIIFTT